jgi:hypothetical protein
MSRCPVSNVAIPTEYKYDTLYKPSHPKTYFLLL